MGCNEGNGRDGGSNAQDPGPTSDLFETLGHELRLATIEVLADERRHSWLARGMTFSDLREAVGIRDPGQFNYHLDRLRGSFVTKMDDEYVLTNAGFELAGAIRAGTFARSDAARRAELDRTCPACDEGLEAVYEHGYLRIRCRDHGPVLTTTLPPAAVQNRDVETVVDLASARIRDQVARARAGGCPHCWGSMSVTAPADPSDDFFAARGIDRDEGTVEQTLAECACDDCGMTFWLPVSVCVSHHPAVTAYYHEHGVAVDESYLDFEHVTGSNGTVAVTDPVRIEVDVVVDDADEALVVIVDGTTTVVDVTREPVEERSL